MRKRIDKNTMSIDNFMRGANPSAMVNMPTELEAEVRKFKSYKHYRDILAYFKTDPGLERRKEILKFKILWCVRATDNLRGLANLLLTHLIDDYVAYDRHWQSDR